MSEVDPYALPATSVIASVCAAHGFRRDGEFLVVRTGAVLPKRCIQTNEPIGQDDWTKERKLQWSPKWAGACTSLPYLILIPLQKWLPLFRVHCAFGMLVMMIGSVAIASIFHKICFVTYSLNSSMHRKQRLVRGLLALVFGLTGVSVLLCAFFDHLMWFLVIAVAMVATAILIIIKLPVHALRVVRHNGGDFWLKGCSSEFLDSLDGA